MDIFLPILNQMIILFGFILIGYIVSKGKFVPDNSPTVLSKLENIIFVPALAMGTFIKNCNVESLRVMWKLLVLSVLMLAVLIPLSLFLSRLFFKDGYLRRIGSYAMAFSNFGFMGNAIMSAVFPDIFFEYTVFTLPFWATIYLWGAPVLLIADDGQKKFSDRLKAFVNPMLIGMLIGLIIGLTGLKLPKAVTSLIEISGNCMSPLAMMLTGMTIAKIDLKKLLTKWKIYGFCAVKLLAYPLLFIAIFALIPQNSFLTATALTCMMNIMCMPMGLNSIVIPAGYGKDTTDASGMALISHFFSVGTIPLMYMLFQAVVL
ncbi:MAG: AEC family transporter [Clostridia bacterium]|nr:AEC family transporter [Clostridia bacterium]